jgi:hypothetical protein
LVVEVLTKLLVPTADEIDELIDQGHIRYWHMSIDPPGNTHFKTEELYGDFPDNLEGLELYKADCADHSLSSFFGQWDDQPTITLIPYVEYRGKLYPAHKHTIDI